MDSDRDGGDRDLYLVEMDGTVPLGPPIPIASVNDGGADRNGWLSSDGHRLYFQSDRNGHEQVFVARR